MDNGVFQISVIKVSFLVVFLAYFDSLILCADLIEVPTANFEAVDARANCIFDRRQLKIWAVPVKYTESAEVSGSCDGFA